jgi:putative transposase
VQSFIEKALDAEMEEHLYAMEHEKGNKLSFKGRKTIKSSAVFE